MRGTFIAGLCVAVTACAPIKRNHGYTPPDYDLAQIQVGRDTRDSVTDLVGAPLNEGFQRGDTWYYVSSRRETRGLFKPEEIERQIVAISFSGGGTVRNIERYGLEDGRVVTLSRRVTDQSVPDVGLLRQIFGNLGSPQAGEFLE
ncbi:outer membrane protein assembly factor BamE [Qingshengfaniella alkalisoli]|uniref:Outer membrane protein assembly factor BamE n=2 Tax=Qingshengfaniella alkalisoli TaxID=2599296 RepID=A0A5B8IAG6_9RHOB|nr:outer membrane protein assembly factor BamE [Qingshengfaniella alkalisoli]